MTAGEIIRWASESDYAQLGEVMFDAVRHGRSRYSEAQREAWMPAPRAGADWSARLDAQAVNVEEDNGVIAGFMSLAPQGYIDFAYIRPSAQGSGLFRRLYGRIESKAVERKEKRLWVHASLVAQPAFAAVGFTIVRQEQVVLRGETFERCEMKKDLAAA